ncbi:MrcB family domain-containing protein [Actinoalloteichus hymeniacidonis]|nr:DUF3578 domain-containing protein [Actinoalloteichus hymeniacidonis]MBB5908134.1 hypothetical protein [Actinoalloteichus hymeniacidonis]
MRSSFEEVLTLQQSWTSENTEEMHRRGMLIRNEIPKVIRHHRNSRPGTDGDTEALEVAGSDGAGRKTIIPWVRIFSPARSPSATRGWYLVYLFGASGKSLYLSLIQGTAKWGNGSLVSRPADELSRRAEWARGVLAAEITDSPLVKQISLDTTAQLGRGYELGNVVAFRYARGHLPADDVLLRDLNFMERLLEILHGALDSALSIPGEPAPEVSDATIASRNIARARVDGPRFRLSAAERIAIERRAVQLASAHLISQGFAVRDVGATHSYDLDVTRSDSRLFVEVKGTTTDGAEIVLTAAEVELHKKEYPHNALIVVTNIALDSTSVPPVAIGGTLYMIRPWEVSEAALRPISYRYSLDQHDRGRPS